MWFAHKCKAGLAAAVLAAALAVGAAGRAAPGAHEDLAPKMIALAPGAIRYRPPGDFSRAGQPADAPLRTLRIERTLTIMQRQVTAAEYRRCVDAGACPPLPGSSAASDRPVVGVSWRDAAAYAAWLSQATGERFRLPTDAEWAFAAGSRFRDDALSDGHARDPSRRWLAQYTAASARSEPIDDEPQPIGAFGANEHGLIDIAGNVWEWTDSCLVRGVIETGGEARTTLVNCGVRIVVGAHRTHLSDFVRDARGGGCGVGAPPANLGFRLVRDDQR